MATITIQDVKTQKSLGTLQNGDMLLGERVAGAGGVVTVVATGTGNVVLNDTPTLVAPILGTPTSGNLSNCTALPIGSVTGLGTGVSAFLATPSSANLATALTDETGSGAAVFANTPTLVTPILGTPTSGTLTNCTLPVGGVTGLGTGVATFLATPSSANLATALTDETGSGAAVFANTPTLVTPILGTPTSGNLSNCTALPVGSVTGLGTGVGTFLATPSSANLAAALTDETGSGANVFATSPTLVTPVLGAASATSLSFSSTSRIIGVSPGAAAAAGTVGEIIASSVAVGSAVSLTSGASANVTSISLTAGSWAVYGSVATNPNAATTTSIINAGASLTSATIATYPGTVGVTIGSGRCYIGTSHVAGAFSIAVLPVTILYLSGTTTVYLVMNVTFAINTNAGFGVLIGERIG